MDVKEIIAFNEQQLEHMRLVRHCMFNLIISLQASILEHDESKFSEKEYEAFVASRESLNNSKTGNDLDYQKHLNSEAIQSHIKTNPHHPEYWNDVRMPIEYVIQMFFDWYSRSIQRGTKMNDFWEFNLAKLDKQPEAKTMVQALKPYFESFTDALGETGVQGSTEIN